MTEQQKKFRVSHFPQIPCKPFCVEVKNAAEAKKIVDVLAQYDLFQFENNIKPDYANATSIQVFEDGEWTDWEDYGDDEE